MNYLSQLSVDTAHHVITDIGADYADKKDSQCLQDVVHRLKNRLNKQGVLIHNILADTGYSSGDNYAFLEDQGLSAYIPPHGQYKGGPEGFTYNEEGDYWVCPEQKHARFRKTFIEHGNKKKQYATQRKDCRDCPIKSACLGKLLEKRFDITYYREEYERTIDRLQTTLGKQLKSKRQSTVEPVFGSLTQYFGMRKVNTIGIRQANKVMIMAGTAYNLKKYLKFIAKEAKSKIGGLKQTISNNIDQLLTQIVRLEPLKF